MPDRSENKGAGNVASEVNADTGRKQAEKSEGLRMLFPTLIYVGWFPEYEAIRDRLIAFNLRLRQEDEAGRGLSREKYATGFTSYFSRNDLYRSGELQDLVTFLNHSALAYATEHRWDVKNYVPVINTLWGNINSRYSFHAEHLHPYSHISGVFYVDTPPGSPAISFKDPRAARWMMPPAADGTRPENTFHASIAPESGKLLLFPSWLEHGVGQNQEDFDRISMSFNFEMRPRKA